MIYNTYKWTLERRYRRRARALMRRTDTLSMRAMGREPILPEIILLTADLQLHIEASARAEPADSRLADIRKWLVILNAVIVDKLLAPNVGVDFQKQLLIETCLFEFIIDDTIEVFDASVVIASCDGKILVASDKEWSIRADESYWVDRILFAVERKRVSALCDHWTHKKGSCGQ